MDQPKNKEKILMTNILMQFSCHAFFNFYDMRRARSARRAQSAQSAERAERCVICPSVLDGCREREREREKPFDIASEFLLENFFVIFA